MGVVAFSNPAKLEQHILRHLRGLPRWRRQALLARLDREARQPHRKAFASFFEALANESDEERELRDKEWARIQGDLWEMRGHLRNGRMLDDEDFRGGHVAG